MLHLHSLLKLKNASRSDEGLVHFVSMMALNLEAYLFGDILALLVWQVDEAWGATYIPCDQLSLMPTS